MNAIAAAAAITRIRDHSARPAERHYARPNVDLSMSGLRDYRFQTSPARWRGSMVSPEHPCHRSASFDHRL